MHNLDKMDNFIVINKTLLNKYQNDILFDLYQPIIGITPISLYLTLITYLETEVSIANTHYSLINKMQIKFEDIIQAREKLEAIGLLKTFVNNHDYVYEIYSPLNAYEFINNPIFNTALFNSLGKEDYEKTVKKYEKVELNLDEYQDISMNFKDIFRFEATNLNEKNIKKINNLDLSFENNLDLNELIASIPDDLFNKKTFTLEIKNLLIQLTFIYNLDTPTMSNIVRECIDDEKQINIENLKTTVRNYYRFENYGSNPGLIYKNQPESLRKNTPGNSNRDKLINQFELLTPYEFLSRKIEGMEPSKNDLRLVEYLIVDLGLKPGVVNVLIDYVLKANNNKLTKSYVEVIGNQWKRSKIATVSEAIDFAIREYNKPSKKTSYQAKKPDWFDSNIQSDEATAEELEAFANMLKEVGEQ